MNKHRTHFVGTSRRVYSQLHVEITASFKASAGRTLSKNSCAPGWETSSTLSSKLGISHDVSVPGMYTGAYGLFGSPPCCVPMLWGRGGIGGGPAPNLGCNGGGGMDCLKGLVMALHKDQSGELGERRQLLFPCWAADLIAPWLVESGLQAIVRQECGVADNRTHTSSSTTTQPINIAAFALDEYTVTLNIVQYWYRER